MYKNSKTCVLNDYAAKIAQPFYRLPQATFRSQGKTHVNPIIFRTRKISLGPQSIRALPTRPITRNLRRFLLACSLSLVLGDG